MDLKERIDQTLDAIKKNHPALVNTEVTLENRAIVITILEKEDPPLAEKVKELGNSFIAYEFIRQDKELRMKMKDVWQMQLDETKRKVLSIIESIER